ncbi:hypothetical protein MRB53_037048 [Persea americana]|nr:hypothetical protein MRB53_037048 [Persea americana]
MRSSRSSRRPSRWSRRGLSFWPEPGSSSSWRYAWPSAELSRRRTLRVRTGETIRFWSTSSVGGSVM